MTVTTRVGWAWRQIPFWLALVVVMASGCDEVEEYIQDWSRGWGTPPPKDRPEKVEPTANPVRPAAPASDTPPPAAPAPVVEPRGARTRAIDGVQQVLIPAGNFVMGRSDGPTHEAPKRVVTISRDFWMDRTEVSVAQWQSCVDAGGCTAGQASDVKKRGACNWRSARVSDHPMNCIGSVGAEAYCRWAGGALPSEAQWEYAARGPRARLWPTAAEPGCADAVWSGLGTCAHDATEPVGTRARDVSVFAVHDMTGNVREWTRDWYAPDAYARLVAKDPIQRAKTRHRVSRGGAYLDRNTNNLRASFRHRSFADVRQPHNGFRCIGGRP